MFGFIIFLFLIFSVRGLFFRPWGWYRRPPMDGPWMYHHRPPMGGRFGHGPGEFDGGHHRGGGRGRF